MCLRGEAKKVQNPDLDQVSDSKWASHPEVMFIRANTGRMLAQLWAGTGGWGRGRGREGESLSWGLPQGEFSDVLTLQEMPWDSLV